MTTRDLVPATPLRPSFATLLILLVTTGLDPVVHAEVQLRRPIGNSE